MKVESFADINGIYDCFSIPVGSCPIKGLTCFYDLVESTTYFLEWSEIVKEMCVYYIYIVHLKSFQGAVQALFYMLAVDDVIGVDIGLGGDTNLCGNHNFLSRNT